MPLPVPRMFADLEKELRASREDPFTNSGRAKRTKFRDDLALERERIRQTREERRLVVDRLSEAGDARAHDLLLRAHDLAREDVDRAAGVLENHLEACKKPTNPGTDPGSASWKNWVRGLETGAAQTVLADEEKLRDHVLERLRTLRAPAIRKWLVDAVRSDKRPAVRCDAARALAGSGDAAAIRDLLDVLGSEKTAWLRVLILDALGAAKAEGVAPDVRAALRDDSWPVRAAAISAARALSLRDAETLDALVAGLGGAEGRVRHDFRDALADATGQGFGLDPAPWKDWWARSRAGFAGPATKPPPPPPEPSLPSFFGIPFASRRVAFLVSYSECMATPIRRRELGATGHPSVMPPVETRLRVALWELVETFRVLPKTVQFTVLLYGSGAQAWSRELRPATDENTAAAHAFASRVKPDGGAVISDALEAAFRVGQPPGTDPAYGTGPNGVDTIFVVGTDSDGSQSFGERPGVLREIRRINRLRRVVIHTIVLGTQYTDVEPLGRENGGQTLRFE
ncbi:MAG: hypothetical protein L0216_00835 [Planctomycetales bacterium]|nr:hypothetical protein [Planctomycetales bacterium]